MIISESPEQIILAALKVVRAREDQRHARNGIFESSGALSSEPSLRPKLGHSKTFPCSPKYTVYLLQRISNHNSSRVPQEFLVQADTRLAKLTFATNTK